MSTHSLAAKLTEHVPVRQRRGMSLGMTIACIVLVAIALRPGLVSVGPLLPAIRGAFSLTHTGASLLTTIPDLLMGALALPTPWLARRFGRDRIILAALLLLTVAMIGRAFSGSVAALLLTTAGVGVGIAIAGALIGGFIKGTFPHKAAALMGVYATAMALGSALSAAVSNPIAVHTGSWRAGLGVWGILGAIAVGTWLFVERSERSTVPAASPKQVYSLPFGRRKAWLIALYFGCVNLLFYACISWIATIFHEKGFTDTKAGFILSAYMAGFIVSTPLASALSRSVDRRSWLALWAAITLTGLVLLALVPSQVPYLSVVLIAFGLGGAFTLGMTLPLDNTKDAAEANAWTAFCLTIGYLIAAAGPYLVGALRDFTGGFSVPVWVLVAVGLIQLAVTPALHPQLGPSDSEA